MYSDDHLDSPPPRSHFRRRPWSPEPFDPTPSSGPNRSPTNRDNTRRLPGAFDDNYDPQPLHFDQDFSRYPPAQHSHFINQGAGHSRREASESSVEALDLADYARTLKQRQAGAGIGDPYPAHYPPDSYPPLPPQFIPEPDSAAGPIDLRAPPSAYRPPHSPISSNSHPFDTHYAYTPRNSINSHPTPGTQGHDTLRRFSLPPSTTHLNFSLSQSGPSRSTPRSQPHVALSGDEVDLSMFPAWSRSWHNDHRRNRNQNNPAPPPSDVYSTIPSSHPNDPLNNEMDVGATRTKKSIFDPGYVHNPYTDDFTGSKRFSDTFRSPPPSFSHDSAHGTANRDIVPWSQDPPEYGQPPLDPAVKEERMRMLERVFGASNNPASGGSKVKGKKKKKGDEDFLDENGKPLVGTVDDRGYLVTQGPKKRLLVRLLQVVLAAGAAVPGIYAAAAIRTEEPPPPAGKPPAYLLYVASVLTLLITFYLFICRPCCCPPRRKAAKKNNPLAANGMMVLPIQGLPGMGKKKGKYKPGGKKWKKNGGMGPGVPGDVQVNLIVDPNAFGRQGVEESSSSEDSSDEEFGSDWDWDSTMPGGSGAGAGSSSGGGTHKKEKKKGRKKPPKRRSIFAGLAMEEDWKRARAWAKKMMLVDIVMLVLWGAVFVFIMIGERCPSGGFNGWCNAYNISSASACLLAVAFAIYIFFDVKDLNTSKASPRTRV
ncbi:hypothetical protein AX16_008912 [Volvariella volvacea WC 439]|nr:hypothetical protein AX16_008912 [Volvariella volvacea WC 439]